MREAGADWSMRQSGRRKTILIADDEPGIVDAVEALLLEVGYAVQTTFDGNTISQFRDGYPDLILLDIQISGSDGRDICRQLKSAEQTRCIPVIIFSASRDTARIAKEVGADDYITKPFDLSQLLEKIEKHI
ncbi:MAG TPA: response regulator [Ktedonobacterales bacterium]|jgi:DNA-binding response OmpR family regulator|nr:response regulator [Ktedonobacterales bacterium]